MREPSLKLAERRHIGRGDTRHDAVVEAPIDAADERGRAVDVVARRRRSRPEPSPCRTDRSRAPRDWRGRRSKPARSGRGRASRRPLAERAAIRDEAVLHGLREHARRVEAEAPHPA